MVAAAILLLGIGLPAFGAEGEATHDHAGWLSLLPPVMAIAVAIAVKDVVVALLSGVLLGALIHAGGNPFAALGRTMDTFVVPALADPDHAAIIVFSGLLIAMVGVIGRSGGTAGIVDLVASRATSPRRGQIATWALGVAIFFDDYANTLIVGSTMRPITDRLRIAREKLAFFVDSTAAPVVSLVPISTWIGFEIGLVQDAFTVEGIDRSAFGTIVASIPYRFYQWLALGLGLMIAITGLDFGPMRAAEQRANSGDVVGEGQVPLADFDPDEFAPPEGKPTRAINALLPILTVIVVTIGGLWTTGTAALGEGAAQAGGLEYVRAVFSSADSYRALEWAAFSGLLMAILLAAAQRILTVVEAAKAAIDGLRVAFLAFLVLLLAWSLGGVCKSLGTAHYLLQITEGNLAPVLVPALTFVLAAVISFATGTAWGTMAILTPLVVPIAHGLSLGAGHAIGSSTYEAVLLATIASVLAGSVFGDHCSPISDTTVLSSMASGCDHLAHVRTQLPYALLGGSTAVLLGVLPAAYGVSPFICLVVGWIAVFGVLRWRGRTTAPADAAT